MYRIRIPQLKTGLGQGARELGAAAARFLGLDKADVRECRVERRSVDARDKADIRLVWSVVADCRVMPKKPKRPGDWDLYKEVVSYRLPAGKPRLEGRPVVVGSGPAGLFAALLLARKGLCPLVLERGDAVDERIKAIERFHEGGALDPESNVQFGEGGAGTFSDGKLTTLVNDTDGRNGFVLRTFVEAGAPEDILYTNKPHIGTDMLVPVLRNLRAQIERLGGEFRFRSRVTDLILEGGDGEAGERRVAGLVVNGTETLETRHVVLAIGHSARDTFAMLHGRKLPMEAKAFAMGVRVEHPQALVGEAQFGPQWEHPALPVADYKLASKTPDGRGVYSFCMCPGGWVVSAGSEEAMVACNGMSYYARSSPNANAAILVTVNPEDYAGYCPEDPVMAGVAFQRHWERAAFHAGGGDYHLPVQTFQDFADAVEGRKGAHEAAGPLGSVEPVTKGQRRPGRVDQCLPDFVARGIVSGIRDFDRKLRGFAHPDAVLTGVETRTSSPVRIRRSEDRGFQAEGIAGLYPCGEGAGYAGGIMSAAMDGMKVAEALLRS